MSRTDDDYCKELKGSWINLKKIYKEEREQGKSNAHKTFKAYKQAYRLWLNNGCTNGGARKSRRRGRKVGGTRRSTRRRLKSRRRSTRRRR